MLKAGMAQLFSFANFKTSVKVANGMFFLFLIFIIEIVI